MRSRLVFRADHSKRPHRVRPLPLALAVAALSIAAVVEAPGQINSLGSFRAPTPTMTAPTVTPNIAPVIPRSEFRTGTPSYYGYGTPGDPGQGGGTPRKPVTKAGKEKSPGQPGSGGTPARGASFVPAGKHITNEVVIEVAGRPSETRVEAMARRHRLTRIESHAFELTNSTMFRWRIPDGRSVRDVVRTLSADAAITHVQPNYVHVTQQDTVGGDPAQYTLAKIRLPQAHSLAKGEKVLVAVIDSGVDVTHPDLVGVIAGTFDTFDPEEKPHTHGTGIAGAIASQARARLMGVAPSAHILAIKAFGATENSAEGTTFNILRGIEWAASKGARIINMSFAGPHDPVLQRALASAKQKGIVLVAAAGNAGPKSKPLYPASDPNVIAVTATDAEDKLFGMSNRGNHIAIAAPGVDILLPAPDGGFQVTSGTSFAAAHISGVVALMLERRPNLSPEAVRKILMSTAKDLGPKGRDDQFGAGLVDAFQAITAAEPKPEPKSAAKPTAAVRPAPLSTTATRPPR